MEYYADIIAHVLVDEKALTKFITSRSEVKCAMNFTKTKQCEHNFENLT